MKDYSLVTIIGEWSRADTDPGDITMMRRLSYKKRREAAITGEPAPVQFTLRADHPFEKHRRPQLRMGTFTATVKVDRASRWNGLGAARARSRAATLLRWYLEDVTCGAPKLFAVELVRVQS